MRLFTLDRAVEIVTDLFDNYVEDLGVSFTTGDVLSVIFAVHKRGTLDKDWLSLVKLKNTATMSVLRCDVYLEDIFRLCRMCKLYLQTEDVFQMVALYSMLHPLYQNLFIDFRLDVDADYDSMMASAGKAAYKFIHQYFGFSSDLQRTVLEILRYHMMIYTNHYNGEEGCYKSYQRCQEQYSHIMLRNYPGGYKMARYRKSQDYLINEEGFILMERRTEGGTTYGQV